jgi:membrane-associated protein
VGHITDALLGLHGPVIYAVVAALVFAEAALFFGFVFPGETAIVVAGVLASQHRVSLPVLLIVIVLSAVVGDSVGYEIGRKFGDRLLGTRFLRNHRDRLASAQRLLRRRGAFAVFLGRFTAVLRAIMPALAGSARMPYGRFLTFNALGGVTWGVGFTLGGYVAGTAFEQVAQWAGRVLAIVVAVIVVAAVGVWYYRHRKKEEEEAALAADDEPVSVPDLRDDSRDD